MKCSLPVTVWSDRREGLLSAGLQRIRRADAPSGETPWSFVTPWPLRPGFIICLCLNSSCQVQPTNTLLKDAFSTVLVLLQHSQNCPLNTCFRIRFFVFVFFKWMSGGNVVTSGIKAQASVFNVQGHPCLCVGVSGSMKGSSRGHFRHLLLPCTTHLSICMHCRPSVHSHRLTDPQM